MHMTNRILGIITAAALILVLGAPTATADTLKFRNGEELEGVIQKVEAGQVFVRLENEDKVFDILEIESMDFNTPHITADINNVALDHFLKDIEAQEIVRNIDQLEKSAAEIRTKLGHIRMYWTARQPIAASDIAEWEAAKQDFARPLSKYQELLNDIYFHVLAQVDQYNLMAKEASKVYVGVKGIKIGSALVSNDMERLPLKKYVPATWYDTIFYQGYNAGYDDAYNKLAPAKTSEK
jgi:hypothetical protein